MPKNTSRFVGPCAAILLALLAGPALAQSIGTMADTVVDNNTFGGALDLFSGLCYLVGLTFGIKSAIQLKDHTNNPQQNHLSKPIVSMAVCALLLSLPSMFGMLQETFGLIGNIGGLRDLSSGTPGEATDLGGMFKAFATNVPALMKVVSLGALCSGAFLILRAILMLPQVEQGRVEGAKVIWMLISGVGLWSLLPFISASMSTMGIAGGDAASLLTRKYAQVSDSGFDGVIASVMVFIQFIGLVAFVRGTLVLKALGEHKDGAMGKALFFIGGGAAAMNVGWTVHMLAVSIGASGTICGISSNLCTW